MSKNAVQVESSLGLNQTHRRRLLCSKNAVKKEVTKFREFKCVYGDSSVFKMNDQM